MLGDPSDKAAPRGPEIAMFGELEKRMFGENGDFVPPAGSERSRRAEDGEASARAPNLEQRKSSRFRGSTEIFLFGGIFFLGILILAIHLLTWGVSAWEESRRHVAGTCEVCNLYRHLRRDGSGAVFYRPEVRIRYVANGQTLERNAYDRLTLTETEGFVYSLAEADSLLREFKPGERYPCWFLAENPESVVLLRKTSFWGWWFLLIPATLITLGAAGLTWRLVRRRRTKEHQGIVGRRPGLYPTVPATQRINDSPGTELSYRLPLAFFPVFQTVTGIVLSLLWNAASWFVFLYITSICENKTDWVLAILFGVLFCGAGLLAIPWTVRRFRNAFRIGATLLEISDHPIYPGRKYRLALFQNGRLAVKRYDVALVCEEVTRYRQGTDTVTHRKEVFRSPLLEKTDFIVPSGGAIREEFFLKVPLGAMHSFTTESSQILWKIVIDVECCEPRRFRRECPVVVMPVSLPD